MAGDESATNQYAWLVYRVRCFMGVNRVKLDYTVHTLHVCDG